MIKKQMYESPEVELLEVKVKGIFMASPNYSNQNTEYSTYDTEEDL